jgi:CRP-like cAMP-binding protein
MDWPLLASLTSDERDQVLGSARRHRYDRGEILVHEGEPSDSLHLVATGRLAVRVSTAEGDNATLNILGPGDYFGELSLLDGQQQVRTATIVALEPAETMALSASAFRDLRQRHPAADQLLLRLMARRIEELSARLLEASYDTLDRRLYRRLLELGSLYAAPGGPATVPLTQEHLAELVGGTRPSVNAVLQGLAADGVIELGRGRVTVVAPDRLAALLD